MANSINGKPNPAKVETIHLKAYIHCEGCKKKVKKVLNKIDGVHTVEIEGSIGKVSVTGTADLQTVVKKLEKSGKLVGLWPGPPQRINLVVPPNPLPKRDIPRQAKDEKIATPLQPSPQKPVAGGTGPLFNAASSNTTSEAPDKKKKPDGEDVVPPVIDSGSSKSTDKQQSTCKDGDNATRAGPLNHTAKALQSDADAKPASDSTASSSIKGSGKNDKAKPIASNQKAGDKVSIVEVAKGTFPEEREEGGDTGKRSDNAGKKNEKKEGRSFHGVETERESDVEALTSVITASRHVAPPTMVLVESTEISADMESAEVYATHIFSDENANNCTLM